MVKINPSAHIPLKNFVDKGSYQQRIEHAKKLNEKFFNTLQERIKEGKISPFDYEKTLKETIPENIKIIFRTYIQKFLAHDGAYVAALVNDEEEVDVLEIQIPCRELQNGKTVIDKSDSDTFMHENFHLFAKIANPKHSARSNIGKKSNKFYYNHIYTCMHDKFGLKEQFKWRKKLKNFLNGNDLDYRINILQNFRYRLLEEKLAYAEGEKYDKPNSVYKFFYFEEKLDIIKKLLYKTIKKARKENKKTREV